MATDEESEPDPVTERTTAPQSPYGVRQVGIGFVVLVLGLILVFAIPTLLSIA